MKPTSKPDVKIGATRRRQVQQVVYYRGGVWKFKESKR